MCVIAVKKKGVAMPDNDSIKAMWDANDDGAGFMYTLDNKVYIEKGFMKLTDLTKALLSLEKHVMKKGLTMTDLPLVMHFRITTHGGTSASNTHPFPITKNEKSLQALDLSADLGLVHNGIIDSVDVALNSTLSDTMVYITDILAPLYMLNKDFYKSAYGKELLENTIGYSKLTFLDKDGNIELVGDFKAGTKNNTQSILFSNLNHEYPRTTQTYTGTGNYSFDNDYYNYDYGYNYSQNKTEWDNDEDYLKPVSIADDLYLSPIEVVSERAVRVEHLQKVNVDNTWYISMDDEVFMKSKFGKEETYVQSIKYARFVKYDKEKNKVYLIGWDDLKAKSFVGKLRVHDEFDLGLGFEKEGKK